VLVWQKIRPRIDEVLAQTERQSGEQRQVLVRAEFQQVTSPSSPTVGA
jgi:hypothetical protein